MADDQLRQILDGSRSMSMLDPRHVLSDQNRPNVDGKTTILSVACSQAFVDSRRPITQGAGEKIAYVFYFQKQVDLFVKLVPFLRIGCIWQPLDSGTGG